MGEDVVHATGVDVQLRPQILHGHGGAFDMPAGIAITPGAAPLEGATWLGRFPEREIPRVPFQGVNLDTNTLEELALDVAGEPAVPGEAGDGEGNWIALGGAGAFLTTSSIT